MNNKGETIHKKNIPYILINNSVKFGFNRFYKHLQVVGKENIPFGDRYIFAPNHQNALMDALAVLFTCDTDTVFMARADIFRKKRQAKLLRLFKILPIYRIRDGANELSKNEKIFSSAESILGDHVPICIMPEGNHGDKRRLRPLVKGIFRIAFRTHERFDDNKGVKIVPVGIDYSDYQKFFQDLLVIYGEPIDVSEYYESFNNNAPKGINELKNRLASEIKKIIIHIENEELYDMYNSLREIYNKRMRIKTGIVGRKHYDRFRADKQMIRILDEKYKSHPEELKKLSLKVTRYTQNLKKLNLRNWIFERSGFTTKKLIYKRLGLTLSSPFFIYGFINNYLPFHIPVKATKNIKDAQFHSSFRFVLGILLFPLFYAIQTIIISLLTGPSWVAWAYLACLPVTGYFALFWSIWYKRWKAGLKYRKMKRNRDDKILSLEKQYKEIMETMDSLVNEYQKKIDIKELNKENV